MSYMPVAVSYRRRVTTDASAAAAGRMTGASGNAERLADAILERRRLPPELLLRACRVRPRVPEQELELPARYERRYAEASGQRVAESRARTSERHWQH